MINWRPVGRHPGMWDYLISGHRPFLIISPLKPIHARLAHAQLLPMIIQIRVLGFLRVHVSSIGLKSPRSKAYVYFRFKFEAWDPRRSCDCGRSCYHTLTLLQDGLVLLILLLLIADQYLKSGVKVRRD